MLDAFAPRSGESGASRAERILANQAVWDAPLHKMPGLTAAVARDLEAIERDGMARTLEKAMQEARHG